MLNQLNHIWRSIRRHGAYSLLNICGLAVGIACAILILLWVEDELDFDHQFTQNSLLYEVMDNQTYSGVTNTFQSTPVLLAPALRSEIPGLQHTTATTWDNRSLFSLGSKSIYEHGIYVDTGYFSMFGSPFIQGDSAQAFDQLHSLVISKKMALKFFGTVRVLGRELRVDNQQEYIITGVMKDYPRNSSFRPDWLMPMQIYREKNPWLLNWGNNGIKTYVKLDPRADVTQINKMIYRFIEAKDSSAKARLFLFPMDRWHLYGHFENGKQAGGDIKYVRLITLIAWIILLLACINFMNLATARSGLRTREVGIRKTLGSGKAQLVTRFIAESMMMTFISILLAIFLVWITLPAFNMMVDRHLSLHVFRFAHLAGLFALWIVCGLVSGSYPAFYLSSFNPVRALRGINDKNSAGFIRRSLVVLQFTVSAILIICTVIIFQQVQHVRQRNLGYQRRNLIYIPIRQSIIRHFSAVREELLATGYAQHVASSNQIIFNIDSNGGGFSWPGKSTGKDILISQEWVSPGFLGTIGIKLQTGRDFIRDAGYDSTDIIINASLASLMGRDGRIGTIVTRGTQHFRIIGIIQNFIYNNMYSSADPLIFFCNPAFTSYLYVRLNPGKDLSKAISSIGSVIRANSPAYPFEYYFADTEFDKLFKTETLIGKLAALFTGLAVFISCLGLFGLAAFTAERRTREIGIRKVLGATLSGITGLLSGEFLRLTVLSCVIAFPVSAWIMHRWLLDYAYRVRLHWWVFAAAGLAIILITLMTVSFQALKAAVANPVNSLRRE